MSKNNVVIIGGGTFGVYIAKDLDALLPKTHQVILIEKREDYFHLVGITRHAVVQERDPSIEIPYNRLLKKGSVVRARVTRIDPGNFVEIEPNVPGWGNRINFEYLIIATGAQYLDPIFQVPDTRNEISSHFSATRDIARKADRVAIIGGGIMGCELAGELKAAYPRKEITIFHPYDLPLREYVDNKFRVEVKKKLEAKGVKFVQDRVEERRIEHNTIIAPDGTRIDFDAVYLMMGTRPNVDFVTSLDPNLVDPISGVRVKGTLQVDHPSYAKIYAVGFAAGTPGEKLYAHLIQQLPLIKNNISYQLKGKGSMKDFTPDFDMTIPMGPRGGVGYGKFLGKMRLIGDNIVTAFSSKHNYDYVHNYVMGRAQCIIL